MKYKRARTNVKTKPIFFSNTRRRASIVWSGSSFRERVFCESWTRSYMSMSHASETTRRETRQFDILRQLGVLPQHLCFYGLQLRVSIVWVHREDVA